MVFTELFHFKSEKGQSGRVLLAVLPQPTSVPQSARERQSAAIFFRIDFMTKFLLKL
jgi:hypothetical protein